MIPFPAKVLDQHAAVLGKTGAGKSSAMRVVVEHLLDHGKRVCVIDPKGDWWGLKSSADGKSAGYPVITFGDFKGDYDADVPINEASGEHVADLITSGNRPCIIGFRGWFTSHMTKFWIDFAKHLFHSNEGELYLIIDEAQNFAPKGSLKGIEGKAGTGLHWTNRLLAEGRGLGINIWIGSQRPQKVHNDTLDGCETLIAMRTVHPAARAALALWMKGAGDKASESKILSSIGEMPRGDSWVWSPEIEFGPKRVTFPMFATFDSFAPPQLQKKIARKTWADVDLDEVREKLASVIKQHEANDPKALHAKVVQLESELRRERANVKTAPAAVETKIEKVDVPVFKDGEVGDMHEAAEKMLEGAETLRKTALLVENAVSRAQGLTGIAQKRLLAPVTATPALRPRPAPTPAPPPKRVEGDIGAASENGEFTISGPQQRILDALALFESLGQTAPRTVSVGAVALIDATGGYWSNKVGPLVTNGLITRGNGTMSLTDKGRLSAQMPENLGTLKDYHDMLRSRLKSLKSAGGKSVEILNHLISIGGAATTSEEIGKAIGVDHTGGYFSNKITPLSTLGLIERSSGNVTPTEVLFPPGLT